jgi:hypothetical protein
LAASHDILELELVTPLRAIAYPYDDKNDGVAKFDA